MARSVMRIGFVQGCLLLGLALVLGRAAQLQLVRGEALAEEAQRRRTARDTLEARRGAIYDRRGVALAVTQEFYHLGVAPNEVKEKERGALVKALARVVDVAPARLGQRMRTEKYLYFHGPFTATEIDGIRKYKGVHPEGSYRRAYPSRSLAAPVIGRLDADSGSGGSGLERALDGLLTGVPGEAVFLRDRMGRRFESPARRLRDPIPGHDVWLTLDFQLQDIAERALEDAVRELDAEGGDIVILDPRTGEILAIASRQAGGATAKPTAFTDPFEPGSTAKLFTAAALLRLGKVDSTVKVHGEGGKWFMPIGSSGRTREINDVHKVDHAIDLGEAITFSSNIAMAKFSQRLSVTEQFSTMRDFGFGSPTGVEFPSESRGQLLPPEQWRAEYSRASVAMGYEFGVTALQLAAAYGAIANDGVLLTPTLVREIRAHDGQLVYRHQPEPVRRVLPSPVAAELKEYLRRVVGDEGTAGKARLANYELAGKTGTARWFRNGRYDGYRASFAALFPADKPQLVLIVKLDNPRKGSYYGGSTAAPLTKQMLERALAARVVGFDRGQLAGKAETVPLVSPAARPAEADVPVVRVGWPYRDRDTTATTPLAVPDVAAKGVRDAVHLLHLAGFRVVAHGTGTVLRSAPLAGAMAPPGSTVHIWTTD